MVTLPGFVRPGCTIVLKPTRSADYRLPLCEQDRAIAVDGTALSFSTLGTTRMACPGDDLMAQDASVPEALTNVTGWQVDQDGRLHLTGATELVFEPRAA